MQGTIQLLVTATHEPDDSLIDRVFILALPLSPFEPLTNALMYLGNFGHVNLELSFRVSCVENYYGSDCTIHCVLVNDSSGHYSCLQDGRIECISGYQNVQSNCTECIPAVGCCKLTGISNRTRCV